MAPQCRWLKSDLYGSGGMVSGCDSCHGGRSSCVGSRHLLSSEAGPCREDTGVIREHCGAAQSRNLVHEEA